MQFSLKLVKITAYARPRKQNVPHYKTSSGTPQRNTSEMSTAKPKAEDNRAWEINLFKYSVNFLNMEISQIIVQRLFYRGPGALTKASRGKICFGLHSRGGTRFLDVEVARLV